jgi:hypothetical protein
MAWALQSDTKETLLDICASQQATWPALRALGVGFWFTDATPLRRKVKILTNTLLLSFLCSFHVFSIMFLQVVKLVWR